MPFDGKDAGWMKHAIGLARRGNAEPGKNGIGCVIGINGELLGEGCNEVERRHDPTAHAEIVSMRRAGKRLKSHEFRGAMRYTTLQPCGMCTMASIWGKISRIVYGAGRDDVHEMYFEDRHLDTVDFIHDAFRNDISLEGGLMAKQCAPLYLPRNAEVPAEAQFNQ